MHLRFGSIAGVLLVVLAEGRDVEEVHLLQDLLDGESLPSGHVVVAVDAHLDFCSANDSCKGEVEICLSLLRPAK